MARLTVLAHPRASRTALEVRSDGSLEAWTTAPPSDGKANEAIIRLVAERLGIPARAVSIAGPAHARTKLLKIAGLTSDEVSQRLLPRPGR